MSEKKELNRTPNQARPLTRIDFLRIAGAVGSVGAAGQSLFSAPKPTKISTPTISCGGSTQVSIAIVVCAGATGLPAGFSLQWMKASDYADNNNTWYASDDPRLCKASFSGNANLSRYNLGANECVNVNVGEFLFDEGASTNCSGTLVCGTSYVFHAFGHATSTLSKSDLTANLTCTTLPCSNDYTGGCTLTQGYWKTHGPVGCNPSSGANVWPVSSLTLGTVLYSDVQLCSILNTAASGNGLIALAHQLIAAKFNIANGADPSAVSGYIAAADALIGALVIPPVGSGYLAPSATSALTAYLTAYNEGASGPGHCN